MQEVFFGMEFWSVSRRLAMAVLAGSAIGFERDIHGRAAGLRTHLLVCIGSALFMLVSVYLGSKTGVNSDPARIGAQIVTGIGFLGAGVVLKHGINVRGLTTAACLWVTAAIGMACGAGMPLLATSVTIITVFSLTFLSSLERNFKRDNYRRLSILTSTETDTGELLETIRSTGVIVMACDIDINPIEEKLTLDIEIKMHHKGTTDPIAGKVFAALQDKGTRVERFSWHR
ncbi:MAG: magnesium transporter MgtC [Deltaproteobacteria bacterium]|nr:MAG: magnesium transporter MgtC [Deltaproteobacteria bacterium]